MPFSRSRLPPLATPRTLVLSTLVAGVFVLLLTITVVGLQTLGSIRGYVLGEGLWAKAQKRAVVALQRYARTGDEADFVTFRDEIDVTLGDRRAREELESGDPDMAVVREGFRQGQIPPPLVDGMATLLLRFRSVGFVDRSIRYWAAGDRGIEELVALADSLRGELSRPSPDPVRLGAILARVDTVDRELTRLEESFSRTFNEGALQVERILLASLLAFAGLFVVTLVGGLRFFVGQVRSREGALQRSEARYRELFTRNATGAALVEPDGRLAEVNEAFAAMFGYASTEEAEGRRAEECYADPEVRKSLLARLHARGSFATEEIVGRRRDGSTFPLLLSAAVLEDPRSGQRRTLAMATDLSEIRRLEEELGRARRMEAMGQLAGGVAHDFNNLLTVIQGNARLLDEVLRENGEDRSDAPELVAEIEAGAASAARLTRQLLDFSRGHASADGGSSDVAEVVDRSRSLLRRLLPASVRLEIEMSTDLPRVALSPTRLEQVLMNLAVNARDAMPDGGRLRILAEPADGHVRLRVADDGLGMSEEVRRHALEPFFSTKHGKGGTGMGLSTVYGIVTHVGGTIEIESTPGRGSTITVLVPEVPTGGEVEGTSGHLPGRDDPSGARILLVDDDPMVVRITRRVLEGEGYEVLSTRDPVEALEVLREEGSDFELIVTDVVMPEMDGPALVRQARAAGVDVPVVYVSGYTDAALDRAELERPDTAMVEKPFRPAFLLETIRALRSDSV